MTRPCASSASLTEIARSNHHASQVVLSSRRLACTFSRPYHRIPLLRRLPLLDFPDHRALRGALRSDECLYCIYDESCGSNDPRYRAERVRGLRHYSLLRRMIAARRCTCLGFYATHAAALQEQVAFGRATSE